MSFYAQYSGASVHKNDVKTGSHGKLKSTDLPIFKGSNFGEKMAIYEKHIGEDLYIIIGNRDTGKIAMLCHSYNFTGLEQLLVSHTSVLSKVKSITRDLSALYQKLCDRLFPDAVQVGDKFHVIRHLMKANR
ncbi:MAG: transposase [bacterium]|nr:transposase [bacterium]